MSDWNPTLDVSDEDVWRYVDTARERVLDFRRHYGLLDDDALLVRCAEDLLVVAAEALLGAELAVRSTTEAPAADLVALLEMGVREASLNLSGLRTVLEGVAHDRLAAEGEVVLPDGRKAYPSFAKEKVATDGTRLLGVLLARAADEWDDDTPSAFAVKVGEKVARCSGVTNDSHRWRKTELAKEGIDLSGFMSSEPGRKRVGFTQPSAARIKKGEAA